MSTVLYGAVSRERVRAEPKKSKTVKPGVKTYVDALAALVPAEVLAVHAVVISFATETVDGTTTIRAGDQLIFFFYFLLAGSIALYFVGRERIIPAGWDWVRMLIPPAAFVGWTMLQPTTVFDAVLPRFNADWRWALGLALALFVSGVAAVLGEVQDQKPADK